MNSKASGSCYKWHCRKSETCHYSRATRSLKLLPVCKLWIHVSSTAGCNLKAVCWKMSKLRITSEQITLVSSIGFHVEICAYALSPQILGEIQQISRNVVCEPCVIYFFALRNIFFFIQVCWSEWCIRVIKNMQNGQVQKPENEWNVTDCGISDIMWGNMKKHKFRQIVA